VGNIRRHWDRLTHRPSVVMAQEGGLGFGEFAARLLAATSRSSALRSGLDQQGTHAG